VQFILLS